MIKLCLSLLQMFAMIKNLKKKKKNLKRLSECAEQAHGLVHQILFQQKAGRRAGWQTVWVFVYTIKPWQGAREGEAGRFSTKCLIRRRVKISSLKAYEVALCRMVLFYLSAGCNYSVWTLLRRAFRDEKGRERSGGRVQTESKDEPR